MILDIPKPYNKTKNYIQWDTSGKGYKTQQDRAFFEDGKFGTLTSAQADNKTNIIISVQTDNVIVNENTKKGFCVAKTATEFDYNIVEYQEKLTYRKLTLIECERLQTVPDDFTKCGVDSNGEKYEIPKGARYKMLGNGWTVDVIAHIFKSIKNGIQKPNYIKQMEMEL